MGSALPGLGVSVLQVGISRAALWVQSAGLSFSFMALFTICKHPFLQ